jgi:hypothetical protein
MRANYLRGIIAVVALATTTGCIRRGRPTDPASTAVQPATIARVTNNNWLDIRLYAVRAGSRQVIGVVRAFETEAFELPRHLLAAHGIQLYVDPIGSPQWYQTDVISVSPGQVIELVVQERLAQSHYSIFYP